jgi:hypothetical protein
MLSNFSVETAKLIAICTFLVSLVAGNVHQKMQLPLDPVTYCDPNQKKGVLTIGMVDKTDRFQDGEAAFILKQLHEIESEAKTNDHLTIFKIGPDVKRFGTPKPLFNMCKPPDGSEANGISEGKIAFQRNFEKKFKTPFENALQFVGREEQYNTSQIFELTASLKNREEVQNADNIRLIIFSNGVQNSVGVSQYPKSDVYFKLFSEFQKSPYFKGMNFGDFLKKTNIKIIYLVSKETEPYQTIENRDFLIQLFKSVGARSVQLIDHKTY